MTGAGPKALGGASGFIREIAESDEAATGPGVVFCVTIVLDQPVCVSGGNLPSAGEGIFTGAGTGTALMVAIGLIVAETAEAGVEIEDIIFGPMLVESAGALT